MKINRQRLKEIIKSVMSEEKEYEEFFRSELEKAGFSSPAEMSDAEKREFFNKIDADWDAKNEELTGKQHKLDVDGDGDISGDDLAALRAGKKADESVNEATLKPGTKLRYEKNNYVIDYVVDKEYKAKDGFTRYILKVVKSNYPNKIKVGSTEEYENSRLSGLIRNGVIKFVKNESVNEGNAFGAAVTKAKKEGDKKFKVGGKAYPVKEEKSKYYVEIDSPREVDSNRVKGEIKSFMKRGARSVDIGLRMNFLTTDPKDMMDKFRVVKNKVYFANDTRRFESVTEGYHVVRKGKQDAWISDKSYANLMKGKDVVGYIIDNGGGHDEVWVSKKDVVKVSKSNDALAKVADKYSKFESVKRMSEGKFDKELDKVEAAVKGASSFMGVGAELKKAGIKYDFSTSMMPMYRIKVAGNTIAIVNKRYAAGAEREVNDIAIGLLEGKIGRSLKVENLSPDVAKHMIGIYKGFSLVNGDGTMTYDTPANAKKAAAYLNKNKIAASSDGKYLYIESKTRR
jgi:hypothetical protein